MAALKNGRSARAAKPLGAAAEDDAQVLAERERLVRAGMINAHKTLGLAARMFAGDNQDRLPTTFEEVAKQLGMPLDGKFPDGLTLEAFEFYPQPRVIKETEPQLILFREKMPRLLENGMWERCYTLVDGSVQTVLNPTADFSQTDIERDGTAKPLAFAPASGQ
jgi:hypothetical protein